MAAKIGGMTVAEAQRRVSPIEFLRWKLFIVLEQEERWVEQTPEQFYWAGLRYDVYLLRHVVSNMFAKNFPQPTQEFKDYLFDFEKALKDAAKRKKLPPKQVNAISETQEEEEEDEYGWGDELGIQETEEEKIERLGRDKYELANLNAHLRWSAFLHVPLGAVGADKYVKSPDEIAVRSEDDGA